MIEYHKKILNRNKMLIDSIALFQGKVIFYFEISLISVSKIISWSISEPLKMPGF